MTLLRLLRPCRLGLALLGCLMAWHTALAAPQAGVPALLQFAEQYQQHATEPSPREEKPARADKPAPEHPKNRVKEAAPQKSPPRAARWQTREAELKRQQDTIARMALEIRTLKAARQRQPAPASPASPPATPPPLDMHALGKLARGLRQAMSITPEERLVTTRLRQVQQQMTQAQQQVAQAHAAQDSLQQENTRLKRRLTALATQTQTAQTQADTRLASRLHSAEQDNAALQRRLSEAQRQTHSLTAGAEDLRAQLEQARIAATDLRDAQARREQQQHVLQQQRDTLQTELAGKVTEVTRLNADLAALQKRVPAAIKAGSLKTLSVRQDYAAGVSLGEEILQMHDERQRWGVKVDKQILLAGLVDTFAGQRQLDDATLNQALATAEQQVTQARDKVIAAQKTQGETYLSRFRQDKRVKTTPAGAWYRIDYAGDTPIPDHAVLDVVVKETLTDGTVIQDMDTSGAVLSQPMAQFPPLFADALKQLKNHGSLTLVVPPELAYGEKGYPPNVPPNATMVYTLRIAEMYPDKQKEKTAPKATASHP